MSADKVRKGTCAFLTLSFLLCCPFASNAEEILKKGFIQYLGWVNTQGKFRTCSGSEMGIGNGTVARTSRKCSRDQRLIENEMRRKEGRKDLLTIEVYSPRVSVPVNSLNATSNRRGRRSRAKRSRSSAPANTM